jgi:hypothetical protein
MTDETRSEPFIMAMNNLMTFSGLSDVFRIQSISCDPMMAFIDATKALL